jgi:hypothetical protein
MNKKLKLLIAAQIIIGVVLIYGYFLQAYMTSSAKLDIAFTQAKTYTYISEMINQTIEEKLPPKIQDNFIQKAIVLKISNTIVTPENVRTVVQKPLTKVVKTIAEKGELQGDKVVVSTANFKSQAIAETNSWDLPPKITEALNTSIKSIPDYITIVDTEEHPNSLIGTIVKTKTYLGYLENALIVLALTFVGLVIASIYLCREKWRILVNVYSWVLLLAGVTIAFIAYVIPPIISNIYFIPYPLAAEDIYTNLGVSLINYYLAIPAGYAITFIVIGLAAMIFNNDRVIKWLKKQADKIKNKKPKTRGKKEKK